MIDFCASVFISASFHVMEWSCSFIYFWGVVLYTLSITSFVCSQIMQIKQLMLLLVQDQSSTLLIFFPPSLIKTIFKPCFLRKSILLKAVCSLNSCWSLFLANYHWKSKMRKVFFVLLCTTCWKTRHIKSYQIYFTRVGPTNDVVLHTTEEKQTLKLQEVKPQR